MPWTCFLHSLPRSQSSTALTPCGRTPVVRSSHLTSAAALRQDLCLLVAQRDETFEKRMQQAESEVTREFGAVDPEVVHREFTRERRSAAERGGYRFRPGPGASCRARESASEVGADGDDRRHLDPQRLSVEAAVVVAIAFNGVSVGSGGLGYGFDSEWIWADLHGHLRRHARPSPRACRHTPTPACREGQEHLGSAGRRDDGVGARRPGPAAGRVAARARSLAARPGSHSGGPVA